MLFNSLEFLLFFPIVVVVYYLLRPQLRWILLLLASYYFYMAWKPVYIILILISTVVDYFCGLKMGQLDTKKKRRPFLYLSLFSNLGLLFLFKYLDFFSSSINLFFSTSLPMAELILPMGISFYTFQTMSYSVDIYQGKLKPEKHFGKFALFVTFFPQLVAGPIERASSLLPQFHRKVTFNYDQVVSGLRQMLWGLFKKVVIADRLALIVDPIFKHTPLHDGPDFLLATILFAFQIYCDFSGYSDIAIGGARVLGFDLMKNFDAPYFSKSIGEFWRRWHISLSTWFRDYVYIPLGGNRVVKWRWHYNLMITFLVSGLWHGANWTYIAWGGLHGLYLILENILKPFRTKFWNVVKVPTWVKTGFQVTLTFTLVCFAWIFFRAKNVEDAFYIIQQIGSISLADFSFSQFAALDGASPLKLAIVAFIIGVLIAIDWLLIHQKGMFERLNQTWYSPIVYSTFLVMLLMLGVFTDESQFIYFQF